LRGFFIGQNPVAAYSTSLKSEWWRGTVFLKTQASLLSSYACNIIVASRLQHQYVKQRKFLRLTNMVNLISGFFHINALKTKMNPI
jgi:hypothetical protein